MATRIIPSEEKMSVRLLRSMYVGGVYHAANSVVEVAKVDGRQMIFNERAVPYVQQPVQATLPETITGPANEVTASSATPITSGQSDEIVGSAPASDQPRRRRRKSETPAATDTVASEPTTAEPELPVTE